MHSLHAAIVALVLGVDSGGQTVLLDFYSDSCPPCQRMMPSMTRMSEMGYPVRKIDFYQNRQLANRLRIERLPTFVMIVDGREIDRVVGETTFSRLESMCRRGLTLAAELRQPTPEPIPVVQNPSTPGPSNTFPSTGPSSAFPSTAPSNTFPSTGPSNAFPSTTFPSTTASKTADFSRNSGDAALIASTVLVQIEKSTGYSCGTGTIIHAEKGHALILTCGDLFRNYQDEGIEIDLFGPVSSTRFPGKLLSYHLKRDIGLLTVRTSARVNVAPVAKLDRPLKRGDPVICVGCTNGQQPSVRHTYITSIDKYPGSPNLQVAGQPVQGHSGGGLFTPDGQIIGICNAASSEENEGFYSALGSIYSELDRMKFSFVYQSKPNDPVNKGSMVANTSPISHEIPKPFQVSQTHPVSQASLIEEVSHQAPPNITTEELVILEKIRRHQKAGAKVICLIRSSTDPHASSEVMVLDQATSAFVERQATDQRVYGSIK